MLQLDEEKLFSAVADPPKTVEEQVSKPTKKQFSWADAVRGKASHTPAVQESQNVQPSQPSTPLNVRWGPKSTPSQPDVDEQTSMKTLSLPSSMVARERQSTRDQPQSTTDPKSHERYGGDKHGHLTSTPPSNSKKHGAHCDKDGKDVDKFSPKIEVGQKQHVNTPCEENGNTKEVAGPGSANQSTSRIENWGDDGSEDDGFFDKPNISSTSNPRRQSDNPKNHRQRDRIGEVKKAQAVSPNVWKSKGNPWTGKSAQVETKEVDKIPKKMPSVESSPSASEGPKAPAPLEKQSPTNTSNDEGTKISPAIETSSTVAKSVEKEVASDVRGVRSHESQQQLDAFAAVDAALHQAAAVPVVRRNAKVQGPGSSRPVTSTQSPPAQPQSTNAKKMSSRVQPGISWSQKVKESLARDAAKVQPQAQAQFPGHKQRSLDANTVPSKPSVQMQSRPENDVPGSGTSGSRDLQDEGPPKKSGSLTSAKKEKAAACTDDHPRHRSVSAVNSSEADTQRETTANSVEEPASGDKRGTTAERCAVFGSPLNSAGVSATAGVEPVSSSEDKVRQGPAPPQPSPKTLKGYHK